MLSIEIIFVFFLSSFNRILGSMCVCVCVCGFLRLFVLPYQSSFAILGSIILHTKKGLRKLSKNYLVFAFLFSFCYLLFVTFVLFFFFFVCKFLFVAFVFFLLLSVCFCFCLLHFFTMVPGHRGRGRLGSQFYL